MNAAPCALLEELMVVPRLFVDLDERIRRQLASIAVRATTLRFSLTCCAALGVVAFAPPASAQQPSCDEWATATEFFRKRQRTTVLSEGRRGRSRAHEIGRVRLGRRDASARGGAMEQGPWRS